MRIDALSKKEIRGAWDLSVPCAITPSPVVPRGKYDPDRMGERLFGGQRSQVFIPLCRTWYI